jgi:hypothetical protein
LTAGAFLEPVFLHNVAVDRVGIKRAVELAGDVVFDGTEEGPPASSPWPASARSSDNALRHRMYGRGRDALSSSW